MPELQSRGHTPCRQPPAEELPPGPPRLPRSHVAAWVLLSGPACSPFYLSQASQPSGCPPLPPKQTSVTPTLLSLGSSEKMMLRHLFLISM